MDNAEKNTCDGAKKRKPEIILLLGQDWLSYPLCQIKESAVYCYLLLTQHIMPITDCEDALAKLLLNCMYCRWSQRN